MRELAAYVLLLYVALNVMSLVSIFVVNYHEPLLGGPSANAWLGAMVAVPVAIAMGLGYAISAFARDRNSHSVKRPYFAAAIGAAISTVLMFGTPLLEVLTPTVGIGVIAAYFVAVGLVTPWITALLGRYFSSAA